jgi:hypothetical protein
MMNSYCFNYSDELDKVILSRLLTLEMWLLYLAGVAICNRLDRRSDFQRVIFGHLLVAGMPMAPALVPSGSQLLATSIARNRSIVIFFDICSVDRQCKNSRCCVSHCQSPRNRDGIE